MLIELQHNGEKHVAVILSGVWSEIDAESYRKALVNMFEACISHEVTKEEVKAESFYWAKELIKDFAKEGGKV